MSNFEIRSVGLVQANTVQAFQALWSGPEDGCSGDKIAPFVPAQYQRVDQPEHPFYPNPAEEPNMELWLWEDPNHPGDSSRMIGLFVDVQKVISGGFKESPIKWLVGPRATAVIAYKQSCCPEHSVLMCAGDASGDYREFEYTVVDDPRTMPGARQRFVGKVNVDDRDQLGHAYMHARKVQHECRHHAHIDANRPKVSG